MKTTDKASVKNNGYQSDDDNIRYKLNTQYFNNIRKSPTKIKKLEKNKSDDEDDIRYKFPTVLNKTKVPERTKSKPKIKVNFWSNKQSSRLQNIEGNKQKTSRRHTVGITQDIPDEKPKQSTVKVRKRVSFLPSPLFSENHIPMVTVPDDLTIQLNEEEAYALGEDLNQAFVNSDSSVNDKSNEAQKRKCRTPVPISNLKGVKRKHNVDDNASRSNQGNENELEFFSKYVVQKLRRMETNQRIYSENLINTVLMLGQLGKLNGKSKVADA